MKRTFSLIVLLLSFYSLSYASDYYISPTGVDDPASGTQAAPYKTPVYAFRQHQQGGHTWHFAPGVYPAPATGNNIEVPVALKGSAGAPTVLVSDTARGAIIDGTASGAYHAITTKDGCDYVTVDGFEVRGAGSDGVKINGHNAIVKNCWVHHNLGQGISYQSRNNGLFENNTVEDNGSAARNGMVHGFYVNGTGNILRKNVVRRNRYGYGAQIYSNVSNTILEWNLICDNLWGIVIGGSSAGGNIARFNMIRGNGGVAVVYSPNGEQIRYNLLDGNIGINWFDGNANTFGSVVVDYNTWPRAPQYWSGIGLVPGTHNILGN